MEQIIITIVITALEDALYQLVQEGVNYVVRKVVDELGRSVTEIVYEYDSDGDGETDAEEVIYTLDTMIPDLDSGYCICNDDGKIGLGYPQYELVPATDFTSFIDFEYRFDDYPIITGNDNGYLFDFDSDHEIDDVLVPLPFDFDGDGLNDFGWLLDSNDDGLPDASPDAPFYPVGSQQYHDIVQQQGTQTSIVIMQPDGTMCIYDASGNLTEEVCDQAYQLWMSENGAIVKEFANYSVTEAMLFIIAALTFVGFFVKLFKRKRYI